MNRLGVGTFSPVPVPETAEEQAACGKRFIPLVVARRLVERGAGSWEWVGDPPASMFAGPIPDGFPHKAALEAAGLASLAHVPMSERKLTHIPGLGAELGEPGVFRTQRVSLAARTRAARQILDALDAIIRAGGVPGADQTSETDEDKSP